MKNKAIDSGITMHELRKQQYSQVSPLDTLDFLSRLDTISSEMVKSCYYMLLSNERVDYTVFNLTYVNSNDTNKVKQELQETLQNRGEVVDIFDGPEGGYEIWIKDNDEAFCYYLFDYEYGVVEINNVVEVEED